MENKEEIKNEKKEKKSKNKLNLTLNIITLICLVGCLGGIGYSHLTKYGYVKSFNNVNNKINNSLLNGTSDPSSELGEVGDSYINTTSFDYYVKEESGWIKKGNIKGSNGINGNNGLNGNDGNDGSDGKNGTSLLTGTNDPSSELGEVGDSYINTTSFDYYVKEESGWIKKGNIKGSNGINGSNGSNGSDGKNGTSILTGLGEPGSDLGIIGDCYLDSQSGKFYKKTSNGWEVIITLNGVGIKGDKGDPGQDGVNGSQIYVGDTEPTSSNNNDIWIKNDGSLFKKIDGAWVNQGITLKGDSGSKGTGIYSGDNLPSDKTSYINGDLFILSTGEIYKFNGTDFIKLSFTLKGDKGDNGNSILTSNGVPSSSLGSNGDICINTLTGELFTKENGSWNSLNVSLSGNKINTGTGNPNNQSFTNLNNGDIYIDLDTGKIYTYNKVNSNWTSSDYSLKGERGNKIFNGTTLPSDSNYLEGDMFINTSNGKLYSYDGNNWNELMTLKGNDGKNGSSLLTGKGIPSSELGEVGDSYIDLDSFSYYTKSSSGWSDGICFKENNSSNNNSNIYTGEDVPSIDDSKYKVNDLYLDTVNGKLYKYLLNEENNVNEWKELIDIKVNNEDSKTYGCTILPSSNGYVTLDKGSASIDEEITFSVVCDSNYVCSSFILNGVEKVNELINNQFTTTMVKNGYVVKASFKKEKIDESEYSSKTYEYYDKDGNSLTQKDSSLSYYDGSWDELVNKYYSVDDKNTSDTSDDEVTMWTGWNKEIVEVNSTTCKVKYTAKTSTISLSKNGVYPETVVNNIPTSLGIKSNAIKWRYVSEDSNGNIQFVSSYSIGESVYHQSSNNYKNSKIRSLLITDTNNYLSQIWKNVDDQPLSVTVDNTASTTEDNNNPYCCDNTMDKLYLLSYKDYINPEYGFDVTALANSDTRVCKDITSGVSKWYWTRSPYAKSNNYAWYCDENGKLYDRFTGATDGNQGGIRPACTMKIN